ncbi:MAG: hypothetical protein JW860_12490 [Sedimentisphaerales bacterium]|nr:hypothetical protein [Sedimentisphaerales bacterium]
MKRYRTIVGRTNELESSIQSLGDSQLEREIEDLHARAQALSDIDSLIPRALALGREVSWRRLNMRHFDVQLMGTLSLYEGHIAEMDTGEGKTLMAPLAAFLHQLGQADRCTHIATANEYLAARDAAWMAPLLQGLGLSVGLIVPGQNMSDRARAYQHDVVYATAKEIVFDSLREPVRQKKTSTVDAILRPQTQLQLDPKYDFAIVDEVDSVLIDQARSPLSIGGESTISSQWQLYNKSNQIAGQLIRGQHYRLLQDDRAVQLKDEGRAEARRRAKDILRLLPPGHKLERYITCALAARHIYKLDQHYVVREGKIVLIDESTGRLMPGRQLPDGIHQALEVQNGLKPSAELRGNYMTTFQTFFRKYKKLAGMTGTASMAAWEFSTIYNQAVVPIPPNKPSRRALLPDTIFRNRKSKYRALIEDIVRVHETGRPILIGTGSVQISEQLSRMLEQRDLPHEVLNAKNHAREAEIIAQAGQPGHITVITNMAGRGVDIKLGPGVAEKGGMYLISTDRLAFRRLDLQLTGRVGRQGDPAECRFFLSLKDDLIKFADKKKTCRLRQKTRSRRNESIELPGAVRIFEKVQNHFKNISRKQRHRIFQSEKQRERMKAQGLWEDWMDLR